MPVHMTDAEMQQAREEMATHGRILTAAERVLRERRKKMVGHGKLLLTPDGKELLAGLQEMYYDCNLLGANDRETYANLGAREVVRYLMDLRDSANKEK